MLLYTSCIQTQLHVPQLVQKYPEFLLNPKDHEPLNNSQLSVPICNHRSKKQFNIILSSPRSSSGIFQSLTKKPPFTCYSPIRATCIVDLVLFDLITNIWLGTGNTRLLIMRFTASVLNPPCCAQISSSVPHSRICAVHILPVNTHLTM
jgi:hypothetical protein